MVSVAVALVLAIWQWVGEREGNGVVMVESILDRFLAFAKTNLIAPSRKSLEIEIIFLLC